MQTQYAIQGRLSPTRYRHTNPHPSQDQLSLSPARYRTHKLKPKPRSTASVACKGSKHKSKPRDCHMQGVWIDCEGVGIQTENFNQYPWTTLQHPRRRPGNVPQTSTPAVDVHALLGVRSGASAFELRSALSAVAQESGASSSFVAARTAYEFLAARDLHKQGGPGLVSDYGESCFAPVFRGAAAGTPPFAVDRRLASFPSGGVFGLVNAILGARRLLSSAVAAPEKESSLMALALL
mmetsp:Transcript_43088/g.138529  ORF Transcript_43088/g.138529 Transcript_43088/m.138529 type:complete len:237 (+) Transcript_43088:48-758(+)